MSKKQLLFGSASGVIHLGVITLLTLICIPIFIKKLGSDAYGVFAVVSIIGNLNVFTNLGLNTSLIKFLAEQGKKRESDYDIFISICLLILIIIPVTVLLYLLKDVLILKVFKVPIEFYGQTSILFTFLLLSNIVLLIGQSFQAILSALQKIYLRNILSMIYNGFYWMSIILVIIMGYGLGELGYAILLAAIVWFLLVFYFSMRYWGKLKIDGIVHDYKRIVRKQVGYGSKIYFSGIVTFFIEPLTKILISNFVGISEVGYFDIALKVKAQFQGLITRLLDPFYPYISQQLELKKLRRLVNDVEQKFLYLSVPLIAMLIFVLEPLLDLWLGKDNNPEITISAIVITCVHLVTMSVLPMYYYLVSKNRVGKTIILNLVTVVINSAIFFLLYKNYGIYSAVISLCGSVIVTFMLTIYYQKKYLDCYIFSSGKKALKILVTFVLLIGSNLIIDHFVDNQIPLILIVGGSTCIITGLTCRFMKLLEKSDIEAYFGSGNKVSKLLLRTFVD